MKLNDAHKRNLREQIPIMLSELPEGDKITLDKDLLENLLFDVIPCNSENKKVKLPVWSGPFLRKIDLSEISFDNVSWSLLSEYGMLFEEMINYFDENTQNKIDEYSNEKQIYIDYSYSNATIDFNKSWEANFETIYIANCNFEGVDLSNNIISKNLEINNSSLAHTGIILDHHNIKNCIISYTNLSNVDLSNFTIDGDKLLEGETTQKLSLDSICNLCGTGINISLSKKMMDFFTEIMNMDNEQLEQIKTSYETSTTTDNGNCIKISKKPTYQQEALINMLINNYINGCTINGINIERQNIEDDIIRDIIKTVDAQISKYRK